ncbi:tetraspanin-33-like isoform X2 [Mizuhopecten yessoensis]|uniref:tetraspanin-33-like isoform X2 n=1 Tax=Mizuhopecten yessoensis TaxID=6573 RepID=UPI000B4584F5|nr:tetraspanin-33-like isoform X2 [Mizuhopecten yessoensis]
MEDRGQEPEFETQSRRRDSYLDRSEVSSCVKYILFFTNLILFVAAAGALGLGIWIQVLKGKVVLHLVDLLFDPSVMIMCLGGSVTFLVAFFGCFGSLRENLVLLTIYHTLVTLLLLVELALVVFVFVFYFSPETLESLNIVPEDALRDAIVKYRDDPDMQDLIDGIQEMMDCCGVSNTPTGYRDWNENIYFNCSDFNPSHERCSVPFSCCVLNPGDKINILCGNSALEVTTEVAEKAIHPEGCLYKLGVWIQRNSLIVGGSTLGIFIPQLKDQIEAQTAKWKFDRT